MLRLKDLWSVCKLSAQHDLLLCDEDCSSTSWQARMRQPRFCNNPPHPPLPPFSARSKPHYDAGCCPRHHKKLQACSNVITTVADKIMTGFAPQCRLKVPCGLLIGATGHMQGQSNNGSCLLTRLTTQTEIVAARCCHHCSSLTQRYPCHRTPQ